MQNYQLLIREHHLDTLGHVNNATYLQLLEEARWDMFSSKGLDIQTIQTLKQGPVILEISIKFLNELTLRETITIDFSMLEFNGKIGKAKQCIYKENGEISAEAVITFATFDLETRKIIEPTQYWIDVWQLEPLIINK